MKILHLMNGFVGESITRIVYRLVNGIGYEDFDWHIAALTSVRYLPEEYRDFPVKTVDFSETGSKFQEQVNAVRKYIVSHDIQVIHTHTIRTLLVAHQAIAGLSNADQKRILHVCTKHTLTSPGDRKWGLIYSAIDRLTLYLPNILIPVSHDMEKRILSQMWISPERVKLVRNGIPCAQFDIPKVRPSVRREYGIGSDQLAIGWTGRIVRVKRLDILLKAFARLHFDYPDAILMVAGTGEEQSELIKYAVKLGISEFVRWVGNCTDIPGFLASLDIYAQTSVNEGMPLSILEAMAAGLCVVTTRAGGVKEILTDQVNGLVVDHTSPTEVYEKLRIAASSAERRRQLGLSARSLVFSSFDVQQMNDGYKRIYFDCLNQLQPAETKQITTSRDWQPR